MTANVHTKQLKEVLDNTFGLLNKSTQQLKTDLKLEEIGSVTSVAQGVARVAGLAGVRSEELLRFSQGGYGLAFDLVPEDVGVILLDAVPIKAADIVQRTQQVLDVPVGDALLGRVVDALGRPVDDAGVIDTHERLPIERPAPEIMQRASVKRPLQTGVKLIDALIPIGKGQRELIMGDRQTGKTSLAVDTILNQKDAQVICIYCAIGQRRAAVAKVISDLKEHGALDYCVVVVANGEDPPGLQYIAPYAATSMAEYFMHQGKDVLIIYDDLIRHARAYRELSLLLRRPPGREAFPGDIFYLHARLLERATQLSKAGGGGSLTALPIIETEAQNLAAYIPTNLISITDGQIYLSPSLFQKGILPAVDVGLSVSRVGGKAQQTAYRMVASQLRITYQQFEELEAFARFGTRLDDATQKTLKRGRRVREVLKQNPHSPLRVTEQITMLLAVNEGLLDDLPKFEVPDIEQRICSKLRERQLEAEKQIKNNHVLRPQDEEALLALARAVIKEKQERYRVES